MTNAHLFVIFSILVLLVILAVFVMKYAASTYHMRLEARRQTASDDAVVALRQEVNGLTLRLNAVEKLLREVE